MGAVFLARETRTGERVALKRLHRVNAHSVTRIKREFRALAGVSHPNLVKLYDLECADGSWFLTMEHVDGPDLLTYLLDREALIGTGAEPTLSQGKGHLSRELLTEALRGPALQAQRAPRHQPPPLHGPAVVDSRFYDAFLQLAHAVAAIHAAGKLHLDLKPNNVLVADGRVVVLDFGLVLELADSSASAPATGDHWGGTPAYMAPEQASGNTLSPACDWYAFGVMLYEALTGRLPFEGSPLEIMRHKQFEEPPSPLERNPSTPQSLVELCMELLHRDKGRRPESVEVIARLEAMAAGTGELLIGVQPTEPLASLPPTKGRFVGREADLERLRAAHSQAFLGRSVVVHVRGVSGSGKTALVEAFLAEIERRAPAAEARQTLVLAGRCYEHEAVPFKALDAVMDAFARHLSRADENAWPNVLPADIDALVRLFPVLGRAPAVQHLQQARPPGPDLAAADRKRALFALRDLFARTAARQPTVVWIDDLQWGDKDSAALLRDWLHTPVDAPLLWVLSYRSDEVDSSPCLAKLLEPRDADETSRVEAHQVDLEWLDAREATTLCCERLGNVAEYYPALVERIVHEGQGSPFLTLQLVALAKAKLARGDHDALRVSLTALVSSMEELLSPEARTLLAVLAVAGRPISLDLALTAATVRTGMRAHVHMLRALQLARTRDWSGRRLIEVFHDGVREAVLSQLDEKARVRVHRALLRAFQDVGGVDPDFMHVHARGAGLSRLGYRYAFEAAERAAGALAFERAAALYQECLELAAPDASERLELLVKLGHAHSGAGRGLRAADTYREAAKLARNEPESLRLKRLAASHLQRSGRFAEGGLLVEEVLAGMKADMPATPPAQIVALGWEALLLRVRGLGFRARPVNEIAESELERIDTYSAFHDECTVVDPLRAAVFQARHLRLALRAGEPERVTYALAAHAIDEAIAGTPGAARASDRVLERAAHLAAEIDSPLAHAAVALGGAISRFMLARYAEVIEPSYTAERLYLSMGTSRGEGHYFPRLAVVASRMGSFAPLGMYPKLIEELGPFLREAREADNQGAVLQVAFVETLADDCQGRLERAIPRLEQQRRLLPAHPFGFLHLLHMIASCWTACGTRKHAPGLALMHQWWPRYERAAIRRAASLRSIACDSRLRLLLNDCVERNVKQLPRALTAEARALARGPVAVGRGYGQRALARLAILDGKPEAALLSLRDSSTLFDSAGATFETARNRYAEGMLIGASEGAAIRAAAEQALRGAGHTDPEHAVCSHFPELFR
jgi:serine/threonine protein kinase/tetratricopeptide (TPR) repeat protein